MRARAVLRAVAVGGAFALLGCASSPPAARPYVFAWPFVSAEALEPRGGTTRGPEVELEPAPGAAWARLQERGLPPRERDRAAILALAGDYRTSFDFLEVVLYEPGENPARPYRSWGTERVTVLADRPEFVSLQHTLVMVLVDADGTRHAPVVQKHWRQDWRYEPETQLAFLGDRRFGLRPVAQEQRRGAWSQTVYQVDDSPRYAATGRWHHDGQRSVWTAEPVWRPLPRRESSVRDDYQVLAGGHRLTVLPTGWVHEQDNEKRTLADGALGASRAREIGVNRYERIRAFDFSAADAYWEATAGFWAAIRAEWDARIAAGDFQTASVCDGQPAFAASFRVAARLEAGEPLDAAATRSEAERVVACQIEGD